MNRNTVGFDRRINLEWLEAAATKAVSGAKPDEVREHLWRLLEGEVAGTKRNSARGKTVTVLCHIWAQVPAKAAPLRKRAVALFPEAKPEERVAIHWAMVSGTYPFALDVAGGIGRLLSLNGDLTLSQLNRRLTETWGERSTLIRAAQRVVRSFVQWGLLKDGARRGVYARAPKRKRVGDDAGLLLLEALLIGGGEESMPVEQLLSHPALFPFEVSISSHQLRAAGQFDVHREGLDNEMISTRSGSEDGSLLPMADLH